MAAPLLIPLISVGLQAAGSIFSFGQAKKQEKESNRRKHRQQKLWLRLKQN